MTDVECVKRQCGGEFVSESIPALVAEAKRRGKIIASYFAYHDIGGEERRLFPWVEQILYDVQFSGEDIAEWYETGLPAAYDAFWKAVTYGWTP